MNKAMIASMREQLRPSEAARTTLLERVGEIPNKREGNSVRKYFAVAACAAGEDFCGVVLSAGRDGRACAVALGGMVTAAFTGTAPALGWTGLAADGRGGVQAADSGRKYLVADTDGETVTFVL